MAGAFKMPDRIDIIAAAAIQGYLTVRPGLVRGQAMDDLARWALELGQRYHALRDPQPLPPAAERPRPEPSGPVHVHLVNDPVITPVPVCTDTNVRPFAFPPEMKAVDVMGKIS